MSPPAREPVAVALRWADGADAGLVAAVDRLVRADGDASRAHIVVDLGAAIVAVDGRAAVVLRAPAAGLLGRDVTDPRWAQVTETAVPLVAGRHPVLRALLEDVVVEEELVGVAVPDAETGGRTVWIQVSAVPVHAERPKAPGGPVLGVLATFVDVTATTRAQEATERLLAAYRILAENTSDIVIVRDGAGMTTWASPSVEPVLGWRPHDILTLPPAEFVHPDDLPLIRETQRDVMAGGRTSARTEARFRAADGSWRWMAAVGRVVRDDAGNVVAVVDSLHDIATAHEAREALAESEERYRSLVHSSADAVVRITDDGVVTWASPAYASITGYPLASLLGRPWIELYERADAADVRNALRRLADGAPQVRLLSRTMRADGASRWTSAVLSPYRGTGSGREGYVAVVRDVHDEVTARRALAYSEERFRQLVDNVGDVVVRWSPVARAVWASPSITQVFGWTPEAAVEQGRLLHPDDEGTRRAAFALAARGGVARLRTRFLVPDGEYRWVDTTTTAVRSPEGSVEEYLSVIRDVQDQVRYQRRRAERESRYLSIAESAADVVLHLDPGTTVAWVSSGAVEHYGWDPGQLVRSDVSTVLHPDDVDTLRPGAPASADVEMRVRDLRTGGHRWVSAHVRPVLEEGGRPAGRVVGLRDIDDEVRARVGAAREELALRELLDGVDRVALLLVAVRDPEGRPRDFRIAFGNVAARLLLAGHDDPSTAAAVEGALLSDLVGPSSRVPAAGRAAMHTGEAMTVPFCRRGGGREVTVTVRPWQEGVVVAETPTAAAAGAH